MEEEKLSNDTRTEDRYEDEEDKGPCILLTKRWTFTYGFFFAMLLLYAHRVNISLAVVGMVDFSETPTTTSFQTEGSPDANVSTNFTLPRTNYSIYVPGANQSLQFNLTSTSDPKQTVFSIDTRQSTCEMEFGSPVQDLQWRPELKWSRTQVSVLLSSYFYGYIITQIPGGLLAEKYGGRHVISVSMGLTMLASFLMPVFARTSFYLAVVLRIILGLNGGVMIPCLISMTSFFAPPEERSKMTAFGMSGSSLGIIITYLTSGFLCAYGFDRGWPSIFYTHGIATVVFLLYWCLEVYSNPESHPRMSAAEKRHIISRNRQKSKTAYRTPWKSILTSLPVLACVVGHFCYNWSFFTLLINLPLFMKEVLLFDVQQNGVFSSLPYICMGVSMQVSGQLADLFISRQIFSRLTTRKLFTTISLWGTALCTVCTGFIPCDYRTVAVVLLCLGSFFNGIAFGGLFVNHIEVAGVFSGSVYGLTNAVAGIPSMLAPMIVGALTPNGLQIEWRNVFYIAASVNTVGALTYILLSKASLQPWAELEAKETETETPMKVWCEHEDGTAEKTEVVA